ncbi:MAG TPA: DUF1292 domain-containing protein [Ruminococcus sp.]|nr:DUF1292 domain-containing protein [Ruminococcus sp.]
MAENNIEPQEKPAEIITLEDEDGNTAEFEYLEAVSVDGVPYAVLMPVEDDEDLGVVIVEIIDLGLESERYDAVTDEALCDRIFEQFRREFGDKYEFE